MSLCRYVARWCRTQFHSYPPCAHISFPNSHQGIALTIPNEVAVKLGLIAGPLPAAFSIIAPLFLLAYHPTRKKHAQIIADLEQRNAKRAGAVV